MVSGRPRLFFQFNDLDQKKKKKKNGYFSSYIII